LRPRVKGAGAWGFLAVGIVTEVIGSLALKGALTTPALYGVVVLGYVTGFLMLSLTVRRGMAIGVAYGIWGACGVALTALGSAVVFGEALTVQMIIGIGLVAAGVLIVEFGSQVAHARRAERGEA
jgi:small multidrug resistance pump